MQWLGWIFICDTKNCSAKTTSHDKDVTSAYIKAVREGWMPKEDMATGRRRIFCPEHVAEAKASTR